jgi:hypothetical protein
MTQKSLWVLTRQFSGVDDELIGDGVRVVKITNAIRSQIWEQNTYQIANWDLFYSGYNHALVNTYDPNKKSDHEAEQEIIRASIIVRIIKQFSSGLHLVLKSESTRKNMGFAAHSRVGIGTASYVCASDVNSWVTRNDIRKARVMWPNIQTVCQQFATHRRILRAIRFFEIGCSNCDGGIRIILFHSGVETLLCTSKEYNSQQVRQRVLAICPQVSKEDVRDITEMRAGMAHSGAIVKKAKGREEELTQKLERILRACLYHVLSDAESVEIFSDDEKLKRALPVQVQEFVRTPTGVTIYV